MPKRIIAFLLIIGSLVVGLQVYLYTPIDPGLSAGINCFEMEGYSELEALEAIHKKGVIASTSPSRISYARLTPCIINTEEEVKVCLEVMQGFG